MERSESDILPPTRNPESKSTRKPPTPCNSATLGDSILKIVWTQFSYTIRHTGGAFREENTVTATEVFLVVKTLNAWKTAGCDEIRQELHKSLNGGVLWLTRLCRVAWCSGRAPKDWQTGLIISIYT